MKIKRRQFLHLLLLAGIIPLLSSCGYNRMVELDESVIAQWAQVENAYQRRADLIPNLVNTVKGYADFEQETLTGVIVEIKTIGNMHIWTPIKSGTYPHA